MVLDTCIIREGHSTIRQSSELKSVRDNLPPFNGNVNCYAEITRTGTTIYVQLHFDAVFDQECARCLETFQYSVSGEIRLIVQEQEGRHGLAREGETADFYFNTQHFLVDLSPAIYDEIMISLPLKPLCADTCPGIVHGGKSEIVSTPEESSSQCDPRWEALRKLQQTRNNFIDQG